MPPLSSLPGELSRKKLLRALKRLSFIINESGGKGSHVMVIWTRTSKSVTIPNEMIPKQVLKYIIQEIEQMTNGSVTWSMIEANL